MYALTAALYHCLNHAFFKSLLFLATGSVLHATKERSLGKLGGLIHRMPWVAWLALAGTLACAGLPPLNGFVSEWLLLQAFLFTPSLPQSFVNMLVPLAAAALVLAAALAAYVMVKFYGVIFLGRPREPNLAYAHDAGPFERIALVWFGAGCLLLGLFPVQVIGFLDTVNTMLLGATVSRPGISWWLLAPIAAAVLWMGVYPESFIAPMRADVGRLLVRLEPSIPVGDAHLTKGKAVPTPHAAAESH